MEGNKSIVKTIAGHIPAFVAVFVATTAALIVYNKWLIKNKYLGTAKAAPTVLKSKAADGSEE